MKQIIAILCWLITATLAATAGTHEWYSDGDLGDAVDAELQEITGRGATINDMVAIYKATEARTDDGSWYKSIVVNDDFSVTGSGDTLVFESAILNQGGWKYFEDLNVPLEDGCHYYTVLFDKPKANLAAGDWSLVLDKATFFATGNADYEVFTEDQNAGIQWNTIQEAAAASPRISDISIVDSDVHLAWETETTGTQVVETRQDLTDTNDTWQVLHTEPASMPTVTNYTNTAPTDASLTYRLRSEP